MTIIRSGRGPNPLKGFKVIPAAIRTVDATCSGRNGILAERDGTWWSADARAVSCDRSGRHTNLVGRFRSAFRPIRVRRGQPADGDAAERLAFASNGDILISNSAPTGWSA